MAPNTAPDPGPSPTRLRQIAFVAEDLQRAEELLVHSLLSSSTLTTYLSD